MRFSNDYVIRQWKPIRMGIVFGTLITSGLVLYTYIELGNVPFGNFWTYALFLWVIFTVLSIIVLLAYTLFQEWLGPRYDKDDTWKKF